MDSKRVTWFSTIPQPIHPEQQCLPCLKQPMCDRRTSDKSAIGPLPVQPLYPSIPCKHRIPNWLEPSYPDMAGGKEPCSVTHKEFYDDLVDNFRPIKDFPHRWKNDMYGAPSPLTGYQTIAFARPISKYAGFKPLYPYPTPPQNHPPTTIEMTATLDEKFICPLLCDKPSYKNVTPLTCMKIRPSLTQHSYAQSLSVLLLDRP